MKHGVVEINHPPYSPDSISTFFLFRKVKTVLKGKRFQDAEDIKKNVTAELKAVYSDAFADWFQKRCNKYINANGDYFAIVLFHMCLFLLYQTSYMAVEL